MKYGNFKEFYWGFHWNSMRFRGDRTCGPKTFLLRKFSPVLCIRHENLRFSAVFFTFWRLLLGSQLDTGHFRYTKNQKPTSQKVKDGEGTEHIQHQHVLPLLKKWMFPEILNMSELLEWCIQQKLWSLAIIIIVFPNMFETTREKEKPPGPHIIYIC